MLKILTEAQGLSEVVQELVDHQGVGESLPGQLEIRDPLQLWQVLVVIEGHVFQRLPHLRHDLDLEPLLLQPQLELSLPHDPKLFPLPVHLFLTLLAFQLLHEDHVLTATLAFLETSTKNPFILSCLAKATNSDFPTPPPITAIGNLAASG